MIQHGYGRRPRGSQLDANASVPAERSGLITVESRLRFRHPLVRSAVYRNASLPERRRAHAALADAISGPDADEHRAWHRAHATSAPDETVAVELVQSAERARRRGGAAAAAAFLAYAVELTPDPVRRAERALDAAQSKLDAGDPEAATPAAGGSGGYRGRITRCASGSAARQDRVRRPTRPRRTSAAVGGGRKIAPVGSRARPRHLSRGPDGGDDRRSPLRRGARGPRRR